MQDKPPSDDSSSERDRALIEAAKAWAVESPQELTNVPSGADLPSTGHPPRHLSTREVDGDQETEIFFRNREVSDRDGDSTEFTVSTAHPVVSHFGEYELLRELGRGGMGVVYLARHIHLRRLVALKMLRSGLFADRRELLRFQAEVEMVAAMDHPNILTVLEHGKVDSQQYFTMKYVEGHPLSALIPQYLNAPRQAAQLMVPIVQAVHHAHQRGILHRDLKPGNVLVDSSSTPYVVDFGLGRRMDADNALTMAGEALGTPSYMAPEQAAGKINEITTTTDIYGLGAILYALLTGKAPFQGDSVLQTLELVKTGQVTAPRQLNPQVPQDLEVICLKCLQLDSRLRYHSAAELAGDLQSYIDGRPITARPVSSSERVLLWARRNPLLATLAASSAALLLVTTGVTSWSAYTLQRKNQEITQQNLEIVAKNREVNLQRDLADQNATEARQQAQLAEENAQEAAQQAQLAQERADLALGAYQTLISEVEKRLADTPENTELRRDLLMFAVDGLRKLAQEMAKTSQADPSLAAALAKLGDLLKGNGDTEEAATVYEQAYEIVKDRPQLMGGTDSSRLNIAVMLQRLAASSQEINRDLEQSLSYTREAIRYAKHILEHPKPGEGSIDAKLISQVLAGNYFNLVNNYQRLGRPSEQLQAANEAVAISQRLSDLASSDVERMSFGMLLAQSEFNQAAALELNDLKPQAATNYESALKRTEQLAQQAPGDARVGRVQGAIAASYGWLLLTSGDAEKAIGLLRQAERQYQLQNQPGPGQSVRVNQLAIAQYRLGVALQQIGDPAAKEVLQGCEQHRQTLLQQDPDNVKWIAALGVVKARLGEIEEALELADSIGEQAERDVELLRELARIYSLCSGALEKTTSPAESNEKALETESLNPHRLKQRAIEKLRQAIELGFKNRVYLRDEPDLSPLRDESGYQTLLASLD